MRGVSAYRHYSSRLKGARWGGLDIWCYQVYPTRKRSRDKTQKMLEKLHLLADLGTPYCCPRWAERGTELWPRQVEETTWMDGWKSNKKKSPKLPWHSCLWCVYVNFWTQLKMLITVFWFSFRSKIRHFNTHCYWKTVTFPIHFYFLWSQVSFKVLLPSWTIVAKNRSQSSVKHACK